MHVQQLLRHCKRKSEIQHTMTLNFATFFTLFLVLPGTCLWIVRAEPCFDQTLLPLSFLNAKCVANSHFQSHYCDLAIDGNPVTMWTPNFADNIYSKPFVELSLNRMVSLTRIELNENKWGQGWAKRIRFDFSDGTHHVAQFRSKTKRGFVPIVFMYQVKTDFVKITIEEVEGIAFGGFKEIRLVGCDRVFWDKESTYKGKLVYQDDQLLQRRASNRFQVDDSDESGWNGPIYYGSVAGLVLGAVFVFFVSGLIIYTYLAPKCQRSSACSSDDEFSYCEELSEPEHNDDDEDPGLNRELLQALDASIEALDAIEAGQVRDKEQVNLQIMKTLQKSIDALDKRSTN